MGWFGWGVCIAYMTVLCTVSFVASPTLRKGPATGYLVATLFQLGCAGYLLYSVPRSDRESYAFRHHVILDIAAFGTVLAFLGIGTLVAGRQASRQAGMMLQGNALTDATLWTFVVLACVALYYGITRQRISA